LGHIADPVGCVGSLQLLHKEAKTEIPGGYKGIPSDNAYRISASEDVNSMRKGENQVAPNGGVLPGGGEPD